MPFYLSYINHNALYGECQYNQKIINIVCQLTINLSVFPNTITPGNCLRRFPVQSGPWAPETQKRLQDSSHNLLFPYIISKNVCEQDDKPGYVVEWPST